MTAVYNQAKASPCALRRFHMAAEAGWDAGGASGCPLAAGLLWAGAPISLGVLLSLVGTAAIFALLRRYYGEIGLKAVPIPGQAGGPFRAKPAVLKALLACGVRNV